MNQVEPATKSDTIEIAELYRMVWTPYRAKASFPKPLMDTRTPDSDQIAVSMNSNEYYVYRDNKKILGVVRCQFPHGTCHLDRMVVHPEHQARGIGKILTQFIIDLARERGASKVWLDTSPELGGAVKLYESMGFKEVGFFEKHYWNQDIKFYELIF